MGEGGLPDRPSKSGMSLGAAQACPLRASFDAQAAKPSTQLIDSFSQLSGPVGNRRLAGRNSGTGTIGLTDPGRWGTVASWSASPAART
jgi:hypothetical protein